MVMMWIYSASISLGHVSTFKPKSSLGLISGSTRTYMYHDIQVFLRETVENNRYIALVGNKEKKTQSEAGVTLGRNVTL